MELHFEVQDRMISTQRVAPREVQQTSLSLRPIWEQTSLHFHPRNPLE